MSETLGGDTTMGPTGPGEGMPGLDTPREREAPNRRNPAQIFTERMRTGAAIDPMEFPEGSTIGAWGTTPPDQAWTQSLARKQVIVGGAMRRILRVLGPAVPDPGIRDDSGLIRTRIVAILKEVYHAGEFYGRSVSGRPEFNVMEFQADFEGFRHHTDERLDNLFGQYRTILRRLESLMQERRPPTGIGVTAGGGLPGDYRRGRVDHMEGFDRELRDIMGMEGMDTDPPLGLGNPGEEVPRVEPERLDVDDILGPGTDLVDPDENPHVVGGI